MISGINSFFSCTYVGLLDAVDNLIVVFEDSSFNISWDPPFSYIVPNINQPLITHCINITNSSSDEVVVSECGISVTHYSFQCDYDPCMLYTVTVIPVNRVGNGMSTQTSFPGKISLFIIIVTNDSRLSNFHFPSYSVPGYVTTEDATAMMVTDGNYTYRMPTRVTQ